MKIIVLYDSYFGNTEKIAAAIASGMDTSSGTVYLDSRRSPMIKLLLKISDLQPEQLSGCDLLVAGSPTRGFRPSEALKNWLKLLPAHSLRGIKTAAFDTRLSPEYTPNGFLWLMVKIFGYAAKPIADGLVKKGAKNVIKPAGFIVKDTEGPLKEGEVERAAQWGAQVLQAAGFDR